MKDLGVPFKPISRWSFLEDRLFFWLRYYDNAYQLLSTEEFLDEVVIEDDTRLDAFFIYYSDKRDKEKEERVKDDRKRNIESSSRFKGMTELSDINISEKIR